MKIKPALGVVLDAEIVCVKCFCDADANSVVREIRKGDTMDGQKIVCGRCGKVIVDSVEG